MFNYWLKNLFLFTLAAFPLYLANFKILSIPTNLWETLAIFCILLFSFSNGFCFFQKTDTKLFYTSVFFILLGFSLSLIFNHPKQYGLGILKSWFMVPILFSAALSCLLSSQKEIQTTLKTLYFSISILSVISLFYKAFGNVTYDNRLSGIFNSPNYLAMLLSVGIFLGLFFVSESFKDTRKYFSKSVLYYFATLFSLSLTLYFTYSYTAWISVITAFLISLFVNKNLTYKKFFIVIFVFLLLFSSQLNSAKVKLLFENFSRSSVNSRLMIWKSATRMIWENPVFGIGPGNFQKVYLDYQKYFPPYLEWAAPQPHNIFLAFWLQTGLLGLIGFILLLYVVFGNLFAEIKKNNALALSFFAIFSYTILHGFLDTTIWKNDLFLIFWIFVFFAVRIFKKNI